MGKQAMQKMLIVAFLLAAAGVTTPAVALTDRDILGKWCGSKTNYDIGRKTQTVTCRSDNERKNFVIDRFAFTDTDMTMYWRRIAKGEAPEHPVRGISQDRRRMIQIKNEAGPRREFRRC